MHCKCNQLCVYAYTDTSINNDNSVLKIWQFSTFINKQSNYHIICRKFRQENVFANFTNKFLWNKHSPIINVVKVSSNYRTKKINLLMRAP